MRKIFAALLMAWLLCAASVWPALAEPSQRARQTLRGIKGVTVLVTGLSAGAERDGLRKADLQADVETRLKQAGIRVLSRAERFQAPGQPHLCINFIDQKRSDMEFYTISFAVQLVQHVRLTRDAKVIFPAETWGVTGVMSVGAKELQGVRRLVVDYVDLFVQDMKAANAGEAGSAPAAEISSPGEASGAPVAESSSSSGAQAPAAPPAENVGAAPAAAPAEAPAAAPASESPGAPAK